jgi:hypothetical protein
MGRYTFPFFLENLGGLILCLGVIFIGLSVLP